MRIRLDGGRDRAPEFRGPISRLRDSLVGVSLGVVIALGISAAPVNAASSGFAFLEIPTGARSSALGGAYAAMGQGVEAAFWNPAGLDQVHGVQIMGGHYELFDKIRHDHFAVAGRKWGLGIGGSIRALYSEPIEERDELGNLIGSFGAHDLEFALGLGRTVAPGVSLGASAQVLRERIANLAATTYAFSLGGAFEPTALPGLRTGLMLQGLGPSASYLIDGVEGDPIQLPAAVQAGASYARPLTDHLSLHGALEGRFTRGRAGVGMVGAEVTHPTGAALRLGLRLNDDATRFSMGAGYRVGSLHLDYAFVPLRLDLGDTHRFSFATQF